MVCDSCKKAARIMAMPVVSGNRHNKAAIMHGKCEAGRTCSCQHVVALPGAVVKGKSDGA